MPGCEWGQTPEPGPDVFPVESGRGDLLQAGVRTQRGQTARGGLPLLSAAAVAAAAGAPGVEAQGEEVPEPRGFRAVWAGAGEAGASRRILCSTAEQGSGVRVERTPSGQKRVALAWGTELSLHPRGPWKLQLFSAPASCTGTARHGCGGKAHGPRSCPRTWANITIHGTVDSGDGAEALHMGHYSGSPGWPACHPRVFIGGSRRASIREPDASASKDWRSRGLSQGPHPGDMSPGTSEENRPCQHLHSDPFRLIWDLGPPEL